MGSRSDHMESFSHTGRGVIVLGDHFTGEGIDMLRATAAEHRVTIAEMYTFNPREAFEQKDLTQVRAVVTALGQALALRADIWVPCPREDLRREEHIRRVSLVLQRHGLNLVTGQKLWPCALKGGINEIDYALRREVQVVDDLDRAVLAAAALPNLSEEIEQALHTGQDAPVSPPAQHTGEGTSQALEDIEADFRPYPPLPAATATWSQRRPALKRFAGWLVDECGLTQTDVAKLLNTTGHRTARGRPWQRSSLSALINGRHARTTAP